MSEHFEPLTARFDVILTEHKMTDVIRSVEHVLGSDVFKLIEHEKIAVLEICLKLHNMQK